MSRGVEAPSDLDPFAGPAEASAEVPSKLAINALSFAVGTAASLAASFLSSCDRTGFSANLSAFVLDFAAVSLAALYRRRASYSSSVTARSTT